MNRAAEKRSCKRIGLCLASLIAASCLQISAAHASTVYASVAANGRTVYTTTPTSDLSRQVPEASWSGGGAIALIQRPLDIGDDPVLRQRPRPPGQEFNARPMRDSPHIDQIKAIVSRHANRWGVDEHLVQAVIEVESRFNSRAVSRAGAKGLMQLMPGTARRFGVEDSFDPSSNISGGVQYLRFLSDTFPGQPALVIAAYNAGEGAVIKHKYRIPPYSETINYVPSVMRAWKRNKMLSQAKR
jgi:soluble lytic murein transglycosylase-like protein